LPEVIMLRPILLCCLFVVPGVLRAESVDIDRVGKAITPYLSGDTLAVATAGVDQAWPDAVGDMLVDYNIVPESEVATLRKNLGMAKGLLATLHGFGVREVSAVVGASDLRPDAGPLVVVTCVEPAKDALSMLVDGFVKEAAPPIASRWEGNTLLLGTSYTIDRYSKVEASDRAPLVNVLRSSLADKASAALVIEPGSDARRVLRELWPTPPAPYNQLDARLVSEGIKHLSISLRRPPEWQARVELQAAGEADAAALKKIADRAIVQAISLAVQAPGGGPTAAALAAALPVLRPEQREATLVIDLAHDNESVKQLVQNMLLPALADARMSARRLTGLNDMKQIALGMLNYESASRAFPAAAAICDKDGKPLLSWRVAILPYIEQQALFNQFHLDEPWDSEHNLKLAQTLPEVYFGQASDELRQQGRTTYQLAVAESTGFAADAKAELQKRSINGRDVYFRKGPALRSVTDGTSNTILVVQVADQHAVVWTKPDDWSPDLADPLAKLKQPGREGFLSARMDGSAQVIPFNTSPELLKKLLTPAGGEVIDWDEMP
jgi:hypothetical protein